MACKGHTLVWTRLRPAGCGSRHLALRALLAVGGAGRGECETAPLWTVSGAVGKVPTFAWTSSRPVARRMWTKTTGSKSAARRRRGGARGGQSGPLSDSPLGCARSDGQGSHSCVDLPVACLMWIRTAGSKSAACRRRIRARGMYNTSRQGFARSDWQVSHSCVDPPVVRLNWNKTAGIKRAARRRQSGARRARRSSPQGCARSGREGPTLVWTCQRSAGCGPLCRSRQQAARVPLAVGEARLGECKAAPHRAVPGAQGKGPTLVWTGTRPAGCRSRQPAAGAQLAVGGAWLRESKAAPHRAVPGATG